MIHFLIILNTALVTTILFLLRENRQVFNRVLKRINNEKIACKNYVEQAKKINNQHEKLIEDVEMLKTINNAIQFTKRR